VAVPGVRSPDRAALRGSNCLLQHDCGQDERNCICQARSQNCGLQRFKMKRSGR